LFDHIDGWIEGTVSSMRAGACQALLVKKQNAGKVYGSLQKTTSDSEGNSDRKKLSLEPLSIHYLEPGEDVQGFTPTQPGQNFEGALTALARMLGLNMGLAVEQTMLDYSRVSYLSSRAMRLQADATANVWRDRLVKRKLRRLFRWWIDRMIALGELPAGSESERYAHEWVFEPRAWVDPDKDIKAALMELDMGLTTRQKLCKERGAEFVNNVDTLATERKVLVSAGIPLVMSTATREEGANQPAETTKENPNETTSEEDDDADDAADE
jgi:capsid protein